jgi:hypothetical protein
MMRVLLGRPLKASSGNSTSRPQAHFDLHAIVSADVLQPAFIAYGRMPGMAVKLPEHYRAERSVDWCRWNLLPKAVPHKTELPIVNAVHVFDSLRSDFFIDREHDLIVAHRVKSGEGLVTVRSDEQACRGQWHNEVVIRLCKPICHDDRAVRCKQRMSRFDHRSDTPLHTDNVPRNRL